MFDIKLIDFMTYSRKDFWKLVEDNAVGCTTRAKELWDKAKNSDLTQEEAIDCLNCLFIDSHVRIGNYHKKLKDNYPTKQYTKNRLAKDKDIWWVDHFTAGISKWGTLSWFSAMKHKKKNGKLKYAGASTHFVVGYHDLPFYIIPLMHGSWHEPRRNRDSYSVEHVNCGKVTQDKLGKWRFWAGKLPEQLVQELPPVTLDKPYRGCKTMQPYTREQIINNIVLKRVVIAADGHRMDYARMSQHTDWRKHKTDMGTLWPFRECNGASFNNLPVEEMDFIIDYDEFIDVQGTVWSENVDIETHDDSENPSYGDNTPTHDDDEDNDEDVVLPVREVQRILRKVGFTIKSDGVMGRNTRRALKRFQRRWNTEHPANFLTVDGIPGPLTCAALLA